MSNPWLWLAHMWAAFAVLEIMSRCIIIVLIGDIFGPPVFMAGAAFTIAVLFWTAWMEEVDPLLTD